MKNERGSLTVEASIALTAFMFFVISVLSISTIYRAQGLVSHATLQTSQALAIDSFYRETVSGSDTMGTISKLIEFATALGWETPASWDDGYASLGDSGTNFYKIVEEMFIYSIAEDRDTADQMLKDVGIEDGLAGIDFKYSAVKNGEIIIHAQYKVKLPFSFFGAKEVKLSKAAKTKAFKKIEDNNGYIETESTETEDGESGRGGGRF